MRACLGHLPHRAYHAHERNHTKAKPDLIRAERLSAGDRKWAVAFYAQAANTVRRIMALHGLEMYNSRR